MTDGARLAAELTVFRERLAGICREAARAFQRSTRSPLINNGDFATGLMMADGRLLAVQNQLPLMALALHPGCGAVTRFFDGEEIRPGDTFIHNDVWFDNIQHADVGIYMPVFVGDRQVAWAACRGHWADIGGAVMGGSNAHAREVHEEALRIPPLKLADEGRLRADVWELILANVRLRHTVEPDATAQIGAVGLVVRRTQELIAEIGESAFESDCEELIAYSEQRAIHAISALPTGRFSGTSRVWLDQPDVQEAVDIKLSLTVRDGRIDLDFTGTGPQISNFVNAPITTTQAAAVVSLLYVLPTDLPLNDGLLRRIAVRAPEGSLLNATYPAATFSGNKLCQHIASAVMAALAQAGYLGGSADWGRRLSCRLSGYDPRRQQPFHDVLFLTYEGGGAVEGLDGYNQPGLFGGGNVLGQDYEIFEHRNPVLVRSHEFLADSAGAGRWRGGIGTETILEHHGERVALSLHGEGTLQEPQGVRGGLPGGLNSVELCRPDGTGRSLHAIDDERVVPPGSITIHRSSGGGGFGPPTERDPSLIAADVRAGVVTPQAASTLYGAVLSTDGAVNESATAKQRVTDLTNVNESTDDPKRRDT